MAIYTIKLIKKELVAANTMAFHFEKPADFTYIAGQYCDFSLIDPSDTDDEGPKRTFSLASAPFEPDLMITTRLRDTAFKRTVKDMPLGSALQLEGPFGSLTLPKTATRPAVFLTGGVGATMVRSMITQATHDQQTQQITFLYSNRSAQDAVFLDEFSALAAQNKHLTFVPTMTDANTTDWTGEHGPITLDMLKKYVADISAPAYYLSGSGDMVGAMRRMLMGAGIDRTNIRSDLFIGY